MVHAVLNPNSSNHDEFEELCALAAIGELAAGEYQELKEHLAHCSHCRQLHADFCRISSNDIGLVAVHQPTEGGADDAGRLLNEPKILNNILRRVRRERDGAEPSETANPFFATTPKGADGGSRRSERIRRWLSRPALAYGIVALACATLAGAYAYHIRDVQHSQAVAELKSHVSLWQTRAEAKSTEEATTVSVLQRTKIERDSLQSSLEEARSQATALDSERKQLQLELTAANLRLGQLNQELDVAKSGEGDQARRLAELEAKLQKATERSQDQEQVVAQLMEKLQRPQATAVAQPPVPQVADAEAKNLFGARDLHIVDVYDVDGNGKNRRTFGRVYYVEKKLLVFYAFDLNDKRHNRLAAGFQAWGYREANSSKPENLGLFYVDDASLNRWVLKVSNPRVLQQIDAVFVTLEPPDGSPSPQGRRLLYANLAGPANHP